MKILVIHGPNLQLLGRRETEIYGESGLDEINRKLERTAAELGSEIEIVQSNHEGELLDLIGKAGSGFDAIVINPAAFTHTSVALRDALVAAGLPTVEVHLSNIYAREGFRRRSLIAPVVSGQVSGFGPDSYTLGLEAAAILVRRKSGRPDRL